ncbi:MAG: MFS transporter [Patescibacteria group bacterium]
MDSRSNNKNIWYWVIFDFANSLGNITLAFYFTLWFVADLGGADIWVSGTLALATIVLLLTLPVLGSISDRLRRKMPFFRVFTILGISSLMALGIVAGKISVLTFPSIILITGLYFLFQYFFQGSFAFYNSFLPDLAVGRSLEKISGFGIAAGQLGNVVGLAIALPFVSGTFSLFGFSGRSVTFLVGAIGFLIFALPTLIRLKDRNEISIDSTSVPESRIAFGKSFKETIADLKHIRKYPGVLTYLISYYFFSDASLTVLFFGALYLEVVAGLNDAQKTMVGIISLVFTILGALLAERMVKKLGGSRKGLAFFIIFEAILLGVFAFSTHKILFSVMVILNGFAFGALFSLSRAFYSKLIPPGQQAKFFGIYVLFERSASILGPLIWSLTIIGFAFLGKVVSYRLAMFSLAIMLVISYVIFRFVKEPQDASLIS